MATDGSNLWATGDAGDSIGSLAYKGQIDSFLRMYTNSGSCTPAWTVEFGTSQSDYARAVAIDGSSNSYVAGNTYGKLPGGKAYGSGDAFLRSYDSSGNLRWTRQLGTAKSDASFGLAVTGSKVFITGDTSGTLPGQKHIGHTDAFVAAFNTSGKQLWLHQFGTAEIDEGTAIAAYQTSVYVAGTTDGTFKNQTYLGDGDMFVREYSTSGTVGFTRELGTTGNDDPAAIVADAGGPVIGGSTVGSFPSFTNQGAQDIFLYALQTNGTDDWHYQYGTPQQDLLRSIALDGSGHVILGGDTFGDLYGGSAPSSEEVYSGFMARNGSGVPAYIEFGSSNTDEGFAVVPYGAGAELGGGTYDDLVGSNLGYEDAYVDFVCFC